jgi:hypothetical protein
MVIRRTANKGGKHRLHKGQASTERTIVMVNRDGTAHLLTADAAENGLPKGRYTAVCGGDVLPAALVAREARYCKLCVPIVPTQRSIRADERR